MTIQSSNGWMYEEDLILHECVNLSRGKQWQLAAQKLQSRTVSDCQQRWKALRTLKSLRGKRRWSSEEDTALRKMVAKHGTKSWQLIASYLPKRDNRQCRERWVNHLAPAVNKSPWMILEDELIAKQHSIVGNAWSKIAQQLPGRTDNAIKNRWHTKLCPEAKTKSSTKLLAAVKQDQKTSPRDITALFDHEGSLRADSVVDSLTSTPSTPFLPSISYGHPREMRETTPTPALDWMSTDVEFDPTEEEIDEIVNVVVSFNLSAMYSHDPALGQVLFSTE